MSHDSELAEVPNDLKVKGISYHRDKTTSPYKRYSLSLGKTEVVQLEAYSRHYCLPEYSSGAWKSVISPRDYETFSSGTVEIIFSSLHLVLHLIWHRDLRALKHYLWGTQQKFSHTHILIQTRTCRSMTPLLQSHGSASSCPKGKQEHACCTSFPLGSILHSWCYIHTQLSQPKE